MREGNEKKDSASSANKNGNKKAEPAATGAFNSLFGFARNTLQRTLNFGWIFINVVLSEIIWCDWFLNCYQ